MILKSSLSTGRKPHYHMVFIDANGVGHVSEENGHTHEIEPYLTEAGEQLRGTRGEPIFLLSEAKGHTHVTQLPELKEREEKELTDEEELQQALSVFRECSQGEADFHSRADESDDLYNGDNHYSSADLNKLRSANRAALTVNVLAPRIDRITGFERELKTEPRVLPFENSDYRASVLFSLLMKNVAISSNADMEMSDVFFDQAAVGRGVTHVFVDHTDNFDGDIRVEQFNRPDVVFGHHEKKDGSDCEVACKRKWVSVKKLIAMFPDKAKEILEGASYLFNERKRSTEPDFTYDNKAPVGDLEALASRGEIVDSVEKLVRLVEVMYKEYHSRPILYYAPEDIYFPLEELSSEEIRKLSSIQGMERRDKAFSEVRFVRFCGPVLLERGESIFSSIPLVPQYAKRRKGKVQGLIEGGKDLQREVDKRFSQAVDIINRVAFNGVTYTPGALTPEQRNALKRDMPTPGFFNEVNDNSPAAIRQWEGVKFPSEILQLQSLSDNKIDAIMGLESEVNLMTASNPEAAAAYNRNRALMANAYLFDNATLSKRRVWKLVLEAILKLYTPERALRIVNDMRLRDPQKTNEILSGPMFTLEEVQAIWENKDLGRYDVVVSEDKYSPSFRQSQMREWTQVLSSPIGSAVPPQAAMAFLLGLSDVAGKEEFLQSIQNTVAQQGQQQDVSNSIEVLKSYPDDIKRMKLGLPPDGLDNLGNPKPPKEAR